jgi:1-aminocyclopropane-1-carboxylate deaminase/D-cysteine desulfhydrase-like pyridoxal-dependent ACC family enzyme
MKYIYVLLFCLTMSKSEANKSDHKTRINEIADLIATSFSLGNAKLLESLLSKELELVIDSEKVEFAKIQKERVGFILLAFFKRNPPIEFDYVYQGNTSETLKYSVGNYKSSNKEFLIYMLIKENSDHTFGIKTLQMREN